MEPYLLVLALVVAGLGASSLLARRRHDQDPELPDELVVDLDPARWEPAEAIRIERPATEAEPWSAFDPFADDDPAGREPVGVGAAHAPAPAVLAMAGVPASPSQPPPVGSSQNTLDDLWRAMRSTPPSARTEALTRIQQLPPTALVQLAGEHARDEDPADRILAVIFARLAGHEGVPTLLNALIDQAPRVRRAAALGLSDAPPTVDVIRALSATAREDFDEGVRQQAMAALQQITGTD